LRIHRLSLATLRMLHYKFISMAIIRIFVAISLFIPSSGFQLKIAKTRRHLQLYAKPIKVNVCTDLSCEQQGAFDTLERLRSAGIKATEMGCPGKCGNGPVLGLDGDEYKIIEEASETSEVLNDFIESQLRRNAQKNSGR